MAPAAPATMKLVPLQRKLSCHTFHGFWRVDNAMAPATRPVLTKKHVALTPTSALGSVAICKSPGAPWSHR